MVVKGCFRLPWYVLELTYIITPHACIDARSSLFRRCAPYINAKEELHTICKILTTEVAYVGLARLIFTIFDFAPSFSSKDLILYKKDEKR